MARIGVAEARALVVEAVAGPLRTEAVPTGDSLHRILAADVTASHDMPPFAAAAMDGFAALPAAAGSELSVIGESRAGSPCDRPPGPGEAVAISTGALAPDGVGVAPIETVEVRRGPHGDVIVPANPIAAGDHVRLAGEDLPSGALALAAGTLLTPAAIAVAASCGAAELECAARPRVAIVVTGDELVTPGQPLGPGQIHESNGVGLSALCIEAGAEPGSASRCADDLDSTRSALAEALASADLVIASGGVSVGEHDHVRPALESLGVREIFSGVALKPGGPTWFGVSAAGQPVFGLPGNPASAFVTFQLFAAPAIRGLLGSQPLPRQWTARLAEPVRQGPREQAIRVTLEPSHDGPPIARPTGAQGSHRTTSMVGAWGLAFIPPGEGELAAGSVVSAEPSA